MRKCILSGVHVHNDDSNQASFPCSLISVRYLHEELALVAQFDACPAGDQEVAGSTLLSRQHSFVEI